MRAGVYEQIGKGAALAAPLPCTPIKVAKFFFTPCKHTPTNLIKCKGFPLQVAATSRRVSDFATMGGKEKKTTTRVVEHIVLLKVKDGTTVAQQEFMISGLRSLKGIQTVIELSAGKAVQVWGEKFTHALHCRYMSKEDLVSYANDPFHLDVISKCIAPIVEGRLALDWEADLEEPILQGSSYGAVCIVALKPKGDLAASELSDIMDMLKGYRSRFPSIKQISIGKNFSPERANGYEWAFLAIFPSPDELAELTKNEEHVNLQYAKVLPAMEKLAFLDYHTA